jgi:lactoylglutathione lyase
MPALSVYFKDPDGHSLEFISLLNDAANAEFGVNPLSQWKEQNQSR